MKATLLISIALLICGCDGNLHKPFVITRMSNIGNYGTYCTHKEKYEYEINYGEVDFHSDSLYPIGDTIK